MIKIDNFDVCCSAVNVPTRLLDSLDIHRLEHEAETLLIHFSTDQVYDGSKPYWKETDRCKPVNHYGVSKKEAELLIQVRSMPCLSHTLLFRKPSAMNHLFRTYLPFGRPSSTCPTDQQMASLVFRFKIIGNCTQHPVARKHTSGPQERKEVCRSAGTIMWYSGPASFLGHRHQIPSHGPCSCNS